MTDLSDAVVIERTVSAPPSIVWQMWTEPEHFAAWYGPTGAAIPVAELDVRPGGRRRVCMEMQTPDGTMQMWFGGEFVEVDPPRRLVYTEYLADESGEPVEGAVAEGHPATTEVTVELTAAGEATTLVLTHAGVPADSPGAAGWAMALDKLEERLAG